MLRRPRGSSRLDSRSLPRHSALQARKTTSSIDDRVIERRHSTAFPRLFQSRSPPRRPSRYRGHDVSIQLGKIVQPRSRNGSAIMNRGNSLLLADTAARFTPVDPTFIKHQIHGDGERNKRTTRVHRVRPPVHCACATIKLDESKLSAARRRPTRIEWRDVFRYARHHATRSAVGS